MTTIRSWISAQLVRILCAWRGHAWVLRVEQHRLYLVCLSCRAETPGWLL